jgi:hypothetical protein
MKLILPIYYINDITKQEELLNNDYDITLCDIRQHIFYNIETIVAAKCKVSNALYTLIFIAGDSFACTLPVSQVEKLIDCELNK